jgi:hypothetical protein
LGTPVDINAAVYSDATSLLRGIGPVLSIADLESLEETLDVMAHPNLLAKIRDSLAELQSRPAQVLTNDQASRPLAG